VNGNAGWFIHREPALSKGKDGYPDGLALLCHHPRSVSGGLTAEAQKNSPQQFMSLWDTLNHEKNRRMGGAKRNPSGLFEAENAEKTIV
jgi:hypothetical protein